MLQDDQQGAVGSTQLREIDRPSPGPCSLFEMMMGITPDEWDAPGPLVSERTGG